MEVKKMYKKLGILAIAGMLLLTMGFADGIAAHSKQETIERMNNPAVLVANNSENHLVPVVTPLDSSTNGYLGDFTIQGTAISKFDRIGAWGWTVYVENVVEGPTEMKDRTISVYLTSADPTVYPPGTMDSNINVGDYVEAYGGPAAGYDISLTGSANYYLKNLGLPVTVAPRGMGEVISNTTVVSQTAWSVGPQVMSNHTEEPLPIVEPQGIPKRSEEPLPILEPQEVPKNIPDGSYILSIQNGNITKIEYNPTANGWKAPDTIVIYDQLELVMPPMPGWDEVVKYMRISKN
jgi:hypothetical protein